MDLKPADDPDTISGIEYTERYGTTSPSGSYSDPKCTLLYIKNMVLIIPADAILTRNAP